MTPRQSNICERVAKIVRGDGIRFTGLDLVGEKIVEVNAFGPGGIQEIDRELDQPIIRDVIKWLLN